MKKFTRRQIIFLFVYSFLHACASLFILIFGYGNSWMDSFLLKIFWAPYFMLQEIGYRSFSAFANGTVLFVISFMYGYIITVTYKLITKR